MKAKIDLLWKSIKTKKLLKCDPRIHGNQYSQRDLVTRSGGGGGGSSGGKTAAQLGLNNVDAIYRGVFERHFLKKKEPFSLKSSWWYANFIWVNGLMPSTENI